MEQVPGGMDAAEIGFTDGILKSVARALGIGVFISDPAGTILWVNDVIEKEFPKAIVPGRSAEESLRATTMSDRQLLPDPIAELLSRGFFGRPISEGSLRTRRLPGGEVRTYRYHTFPYGPEGEGAGEDSPYLVHCLIDATSEKKLAETYQTSQHQLSSMKEILDILYESMSNTRHVINLILVAVTSRLGFGFNRAFFLQVQGNRLRGRMGIGPANPADAHRIWTRLAESNPNLRESLRLLSEGGPPDPHTAAMAARIEIPLSAAEDNPAGAGIVDVIRRGKAARILRSDRLSKVDAELFGVLGADAIAVVPLQIEQALEGVLIADNFITRKPITDEDLSILKTFSGYAGLALEKSRLYEEQKKNIEKLQAANQELQSNQQKLLRAEKLSAIGELAAFVSHEIRNPLVAIGGLARSALSDGVEKPETVEALQIIATEVRRLERFLKETLDFVKPSVGELELVDLNIVSRDCASTFKEELSEHGIEVVYDFSSVPLHARIDSNLLRAALSNLIKNAIEAMADGGKLRVRTERNGHLAKIKVGDTGPGISPEIRTRIFDLFFTTKKGGTGLGLAMASQSIKSLGGTITMGDGGGGGEYRTWFEIALPLAA
jgi:signal transduction histidine kinase